MDRKHIAFNWMGVQHPSVFSMNTWYRRNHHVELANTGQRFTNIELLLVLMRHGQSEQNIGKTNLPTNESVRLTPLGNEETFQSGNLYKALKLPAPFAAFVSELGRSEESLLNFLTATGFRPPIIQSPYLNEIDWGLLDVLGENPDFGKYPILATLDQVRRQQPRYFQSKPFGESPRVHRLRVKSFFEKLYRDFMDKPVLAVCHHKTIIQILFNIFGNSWEQFEAFEKAIRVPNGGLVVLSKSKHGWQLLGWNVAIRNPAFFQPEINRFAPLSYNSLLAKYGK